MFEPQFKIGSIIRNKDTHGFSIITGFDSEGCQYIFWSYPINDFKIYYQELIEKNYELVSEIFTPEVSVWEELLKYVPSGV